MTEQPAPSRFRVPAWVWIIAALGLVVAIQFWLAGRSNNSNGLPITDVASMLANGQVKQLDVDGNRLEFTAEDGSVIISVKEDGSAIEQFRNLGVSEEALNSADIVFQDPAIGNMLWTITISLGPILLLIWVFYRSFKRFGLAGDKLLSGQNKAGTPGIGDRLRELKASYEAELITEEEYEKKKGELLTELWPVRGS